MRILLAVLLFGFSSLSFASSTACCMDGDYAVDCSSTWDNSCSGCAWGGEAPGSMIYGYCQRFDDEDGSPVGDRSYDPADPAHPPPPPVKPDTGIMSLALGYGLAMAGIAIAAVGAVVAVPVLAAGGAAVALTGVLFAATGGSSSQPSAQAAVNATAPIQATLTPATQPVPAPGGGTPAAIATNSDGKFTPSGGGGASGTWANGASGSWEYTAPGATTPSATVSADGSTFSQTVPVPQSAVDAGAAPGSSSLVVTRLSDGSLSVSQSTNVNVADGSGNPTTMPVAYVSSYTNYGVPVGDSQTYVSQTTANGSATGGGSNVTVIGTGGTGTGGTGTGGGNTSGSGDCGGVQCATEATQLANKAALQAIRDALKNSETLNDPTAKTGSEIKTAAGLENGFSGLLGWRLPAHQSTCPKFEFTWSAPGSSQVISESAHCDLFSQNSAVISVVFMALWTIVALRIVLKA